MSMPTSHHACQRTISTLTGTPVVSWCRWLVMTYCAPIQKGCKQPLRRRPAMPCYSRSTRLAPSQNLSRQSACPRQAITASCCKFMQACTCCLTGHSNVTNKSHKKPETASAKNNACTCRFAAATVCIRLSHQFSMRLMSDNNFGTGTDHLAWQLLQMCRSTSVLTIQFWQLSGNAVKCCSACCCQMYMTIHVCWTHHYQVCDGLSYVYAGGRMGSNDQP